MVTLSKSLLITKARATAIHFSVSVLIFILLTYLIYYVWYPQPYFTYDGGWQGVKIVAAVDLVLGPLITFLIFNLNKSRKEIIFDISIILIIQISALIYGVNTTYQQRPVANVLIENVLVSATLGDYGSQLDVSEQLKSYSSELPPVIFAEIPMQIDLLKESVRISEEEGIPSYAQIQFYKPKNELIQKLIRLKSFYLENLKAQNPGIKFQEWLELKGHSFDEVLIAPFNARYGLVWFVLNMDADLIDYYEIESIVESSD